MKGVDALGLALVTLCGALAALVEAMLVPLYAGTVVVPIAAVLAVAGNVVLPRMGRDLVPRTAAGLAPLLAWLAVMLMLLAGRPEGDVAFPAKPTAVVWVFYATLLGGVVAGIASVALSAPPPVRREHVEGVSR